MLRPTPRKALAELKGERQDVKFAAPTRSCSRTSIATKPPNISDKEFGPPFAAAVGKLPPGSWQGPIQSGFGWHLVFVDTVIPARAPAFEEIEPDVKQAWLADQKEKAVRKAYEDMRAKYTVLMPAPPPEGAPPQPKIDPNAAALRSIPDDVIPR